MRLGTLGTIGTLGTLGTDGTPCGEACRDAACYVSAPQSPDLICRGDVARRVSTCADHRKYNI